MLQRACKEAKIAHVQINIFAFALAFAIHLCIYLRIYMYDFPSYRNYQVNICICEVGDVMPHGRLTTHASLRITLAVGMCMAAVVGFRLPQPREATQQTPSTSMSRLLGRARLIAARQPMGNNAYI